MRSFLWHLAPNQLMNQIRAWRIRVAAREHLAHLDAHTLGDMGLNCTIAAHEARQPFWRPIRPRPE